MIAEMARGTKSHDRLLKAHQKSAASFCWLATACSGGWSTRSWKLRLQRYPWGDTLPILHRADWRLSNLECVISDRGTPWSASPKAFHFRSRAKNIAVLEAARMNAVSLANNHVLDYGYDAMFEMLRILDRAGIIYTGAGANLAQASRLATADVHGCKIGLIALTDNEPGWEAGTDWPGGFLCPHRPY